MLTTQTTRDPRSALTPAGETPSSLRLPSLHDDPHKIHQLLDMLGLPSGTEVRVTTVAASVIVR